MTFLSAEMPKKKAAVECFSQTLQVCVQPEAETLRRSRPLKVDPSPQIQPVFTSRRWPHTLVCGDVDASSFAGRPYFVALEDYQSVWYDVPVTADSNPLFFRMVSVNASIFLFGAAKAGSWAIRGAVFKFDVHQKRLTVSERTTANPVETQSHSVSGFQEVVGMTDYRTDFALSVVGDRVYIIGGKRNERDLNDVEVFDAKTNTIRLCEGLPLPSVCQTATERQSFHLRAALSSLRLHRRLCRERHLPGRRLQPKHHAAHVQHGARSLGRGGLGRAVSGSWGPVRRTNDNSPLLALHSRGCVCRRGETKVGWPPPPTASS